jgi:hypothetical protein
MFNRHQALFRRVLELMMRPLDPYQKPAIRFQSLDDLPAIHGGYYNYHAEEKQKKSGIKTISTSRLLRKICW